MGGVPAAAFVQGCAATGLPAYRYDHPGTAIDLYLKWYPELLTTGGAIELLLTGGVKSLYVVRLSFSRFAAVSPVCTHKGCLVGMGENIFKCPCHGSKYSLDGSLISGPAEKPLRSFRTQYLETSVRIFLA